MEKQQETQTYFIKLDKADLRRVIALAFSAAFVGCLLALLLATRKTNG